MPKYYFVIFLCIAACLSARQPYHATASVGTSSAKVSAPNVLDLMNDLKTTSLEQLLPLYTPTSQTAIDFNFRGIFALTAFPADSTTLFVEFPQTGNMETFTGATRDDSLKLFKEFIRDGGRRHRLFKAYARYSPIDPIAGNPNSLMASMPQADYLLGHLASLSGCDDCWNAQPLVHQFQAGSTVGRSFSSGFDTTSVSLPLRYSYSPDLNWALILDAPLTYVRNGGASSIFGSVGVGFRFPFTHSWSLTSVLRGGAGGSLDLCTAGCFVSSGITSVYNYKICDFVASLNNYAGYINSTNFWMSGVNFNYNLKSWVFKNGLSLTLCKGITLYNRPINFSLSFEDTYFTKNRLFIKHYDEVEFSIIASNINPCLNYDALTLGFNYQYGQKDYRGYFVNLTYHF